jgi:hypothetical protein
MPPRRVSGDQPQGSGGSRGGARGQSQQPVVGGGGRSGGSGRQVPPPPQRGGGRYYDDGGRQGSRQGYRQPVNRRQGYYEPAPRRDPFPIVMGGIIGALAMGLVLVIFLLTQNNNNNPIVSSPSGSNPGSTSAPQTGAVEPTRIPFEEFKTLYDNPATRPIVVDVRSKMAYDEGHIAGAINIPVAETDARLGEFPRDRLIVTYCQ